MARPRTPSNVLQLKGAFKKDPQRERVDPRTTGVLGAPPSHLTKAQSFIWQEIQARAPEGVITTADRFAVEEMCRLIDQVRHHRADMMAAERSLLRQYLGQFGMTPADRAKIAAPPKKPANRFADLAPQTANGPSGR